jgi:ferredoxin-type protein NapF
MPMKTRRELLFQLAGKKPALRPPWTRPDYAAECTGCGDCIPVCPEGVLVAGRGGIPHIDPRGDGCIQCGACAEACPAQVFDIHQPAFSWRAAITDRCLTEMGVSCRSCEDACPELAIRFRPALGGISRPSIDADQCTGCMACMPVCPQQAIEVREPRRAST